MKKSKLIGIGEAAKILGVSLPTFRQMRKGPFFKSLEIKVGKSIKFNEHKIREYCQGGIDERTDWITPKGQLEIVSTQSNLETEDGFIDLRGIDYMDHDFTKEKRSAVDLFINKEIGNL